MDLDGDGRNDILSGSYSRHDESMAGLFQVLWGEPGGGFRKPEPLRGTDGELLIVPTGTNEDDVVDRICTRPFAADLDGDGHLDVVTGNFRGTFAVFRGQGGGKFTPKATWLEAGGERLAVDGHSDPCLVDWDGDGDLDLLSGTAAGGAFLFTNQGTRTAPRFDAPPRPLVAPVGHDDAGVRFGDQHLTGPQQATRVFAADVDGDGKLDLLLGDSVTLHHLQPGVDASAATTALADVERRLQALFASQGEGEPSATEQQQFATAYEALQQERAKFVRDERTGFVWLLRRR